MPYEIQLDETPTGYPIDDATSVEGHSTHAVVTEFTTSEDGELFISRLEGWPNIILSKLPRDAHIHQSMVDHLVAIIRKDLRTTVYANEVPIRAVVRATRPMQVGEEIRDSDVTDIVELHLGDIDIPWDAGILIVLSAEWRKGLFFDFNPLIDNADRSYDLGKLMGSYYAYLRNQSVFRLIEPDWQFLIDQQWFPFFSLPKSIVRTLVGRARSRSNLDILVPEIREAVSIQLPIFLMRWAGSPFFKAHIDLLRHAAKKFMEGDYVSTTAIIFPRIEGLMRELHLTLGTQEKLTQGILTKQLIEARQVEFHSYSWLLPEMFKKYLREVYFANFEPGTPAKISRNSFAHGVAAPGDFNEKTACIGFLILAQLSWFLPSKSDSMLLAKKSTL